MSSMATRRAVRPVGHILSLLIGAIALTVNVALAGATEIHVFSGAAPQNALRDLAPEFERATGDRVEFTFRIVSEIQEKLAAGEKADLILLPAPLIAATEKTVPLRSEGQNCPGPRWHRSHHAAGYNAAGYLDGRSRAQDVT